MLVEVVGDVPDMPLQDIPARLSCYVSGNHGPVHHIAYHVTLRTMVSDLWRLSSVDRGDSWWLSLRSESVPCQSFLEVKCGIGVAK